MLQDMAIDTLILVRHGESTGNVARERAEAAGAEVIDVAARDPDVPLSELGARQAAALGRWLGGLEPGQRPQATWCSPYRRARQTADLALHAGGLDLPLRFDDRLRDRELGILDMLTGRGVRQRFPDEAARRRWLGKLYYRPPGGESWADVALRLRSLLAELQAAAVPQRVLVVCHDAVIVLFRYVLQRLEEAELMEVARTSTVGNASVTTLHLDPGGGPWQVALANHDEYLDALGAAPTAHPGERGGAPTAHPGERGGAPAEHPGERGGAGA